MSETDELDAWIDAGTALLGIPMQPEWRRRVRMHLAITLDHATTRAGISTLPDEADPAPMFRA